jgi:hypothetical protein
MKSFKEFLAESKPSYEWFSFAIEEYHVHILFESAPGCMLTEAKHKGIPLGGQYSAKLHKAHSPAGQEHLHVYAKNNYLFALNKDGTAHDASHKVQIPSKVAKAIHDKFPSVTLPPNHFIENAPTSVSAAVGQQLLLG